ncbi:MAG: flagellar hook-basal body complex protein FliE [Thermodesulfobacteriota bacterium]
MVKELTGLSAGALPGEAARARGPAGAKGFGEFLSESLQKVDALQKDADAAVTQIAQGGDVGIQEAMVAIEKADVSFKLMMEVRQKILDAYQEVMRMQV